MVQNNFKFLKHVDLKAQPGESKNISGLSQHILRLNFERPTFHRFDTNCPLRVDTNRGTPIPEDCTYDVEEADFFLGGAAASQGGHD